MRKMINESFDVDDDNIIKPKSDNFYLSPEAKSEIYRRYLKNLNYSQNSSESSRTYAKMFFIQENFTSLSVDMDLMPTDFTINDSDSFIEAHLNVIRLLLIVIYAIIFVLGVLGNVVTCIVIAKNRSMHTAVNFYLFSLAVSDLFLLLTG